MSNGSEEDWVNNNMGILAVLWEKWREFLRDFYKITLAATVSPLMYLLVFGLGIQTTSHGEPYLNFLVPGIVAMSTMTGSFSAVAQNMSVQRLYEKALDQVMVSPTPLWQFILGQVIGGALRGMYAAGVILLITLPISSSLIFNGWSFLIMFLNGTVFATIALVLSFLAKSYSDAPRYTAYIIVPMSFLCNTFFSTDQMPMGFRQVIGALPLSQASDMIRRISAGGQPGILGFVVLLIYLVIFAGLSVAFIYRKKNL
ncbi:ABC transporter permease [Mobilibacterium timonense]|uniref:ABC transporter permease n=1 Tax=Mobilibacterium timonense TaxID=1871012 RepID=UPI001F44009D|nr:ABC transporter permease [Mobilibacterium timonense]